MKKKNEHSLNFKLALQDPVKCIQSGYRVLDVVQEDDQPINKITKLLFPFLVTANHYEIDIRDALEKGQRMIQDLEETSNPTLKAFKSFLNGNVSHGK